MSRDPFFERRRRAAYQAALERPELREKPSHARRSPSGPISAPIKTVDPGTRALIDAAIAKRAGT